MRRDKRSIQRGAQQEKKVSDKKVKTVETMVRERSRAAIGRGVGENGKLGIGGRQNDGLEHHVGTEEEQRAEDDGASTYDHSRSVVREIPGGG
jgi:hypothetical protein